MPDQPARRQVSLRINEITPEEEDQLAALVAAGNFPSVACAAVGISPQQYNNWIKRGEGRSRDQAATPEYVAFAVKMRKAEAEAEVALVKVATEGSVKDPSLAVKILGRRFRDRWGEVVTHKNDWTVLAITAIKSGEVTWRDLESVYDSHALEEIKTRLLEAGEEPYWEEIPKEKVDAEQSQE